MTANPYFIPTLLVDRANFKDVALQIIEEVKAAPYIGFDIETHNGYAHEGLSKIKSLVFDIRRTIITGFSIYPKGGKQAYYINLNHADVQNRLTWEEVKPLLCANLYICHNAQFELTMMREVLGFRVYPYICTMQLAITAYGPDTYSMNKFLTTPLGAIETWLPAISAEFSSLNPDGRGPLTTKQGELMSKIAGKASKARHSYNGFVDEISFGYGLKKAVKSFFNYKMTEYKEVLNNSAHAQRQKTLKKSQQEETHMGHLTGNEVAAYGAEDAYWCLNLYDVLIEFINKNNPEVLQTFINQENPMVEIFSHVWSGGININKKAIKSKLEEEQKNMAQVLRDMKKALKQMFPFEPIPNSAMIKDQPWYAKNWAKYRQQWVDFANSPDYPDTPEGIKQQILQTNGGTANSYGERKQGIINISHYMPQRVLYYDLMGVKMIKSKGKVQSDKTARGKIKEIVGEDTPAGQFILLLNKLSQVDQVCKLYLNPYLNLIDPETGKIYPSISSMLATRRMSMSNPNGQQLAKRGESVYVRGFYEADYDDHVIISADWNSIELVIPGEMSQDPEFVRCFSKVPYDDLHSIAASAMLGMTEEEFNNLKILDESVKEVAGVTLQDTQGNHLAPKAFRKWARTEIGKGSNFNYWYSGSLSTIAERLGWEDSEHWEKVEIYRNRFPVAEKWRLDTIAFAIANGYVELPDHHRRYRFEATEQWRTMMMDKFIQAMDTEGVRIFARRFIKLWSTRAKNQAVNAKVQGTAAALAKRAIIKLRAAIEAKGWGPRECRFMLPIHDELVCSVHKDLVLEYIAMIREVMCDHPDLFKICRLNCSVSMGRTFEPYGKKAVYGQIELDESPAFDWVDKSRWDGKMTDEEILKTVDYLFTREKEYA